MQPPYTVKVQLMDGRTTITKIWYTHEEQVSPVTFQLSKEDTEKDNEMDQNMAKFMTQLYSIKECYRSRHP